MEEYSVKLSEIIDEFSLSEVVMPKNGRDILITKKEVNRPGLFLAGFHKYFDRERIQILGKTEYEYLDSLQEEELISSLESLMKEKPVCIIFSHGRRALPKTVELATRYEVPVLITPLDTSYFMASLISKLNVDLAERIVRHGVLVEVYGEGVLLLGDSGVGKSETAIDLVKRGHRLIADDAVEIKKVSDKTLVGEAPELIRHYVELRGVGVIDVRRLFGMGAVKMTEKIDLVINLELWNPKKFYDRLGIDTEYTEIMGIKLPSMTIPVRPGRNLALIVEIAAMNNRQKLMGYNTAQEIEDKLASQLSVNNQ